MRSSQSRVAKLENDTDTKILTPEKTQAPNNKPNGRSSRRFVIPKHLSSGGTFSIWGASGPGRLLSRLANEDALREREPQPLTPIEIAELIELFKDEPLPPPLRSLLVRELLGERNFLPGPKGVRTQREIIEMALLPSFYKEAVADARLQREGLKETERAKPRRAKLERVPTVSKLAADLIRTWLPTLKHLSDKGIANKVSALKDDSEKRPRSGQSDPQANPEP